MVTASLVVAAACTALPQQAAIARTAAEALPAKVIIDGKEYPNPLLFDDGGAVTTAAEWEANRRAQLLAQFRQNVYGQDLPLPTAQTFQVTTTDFPTVKRKVVTVSVTGPQGRGSFAVTLFVPKTGSKPLGTFLLIDHRGSVGADPGQSSGYAPVATILKAGYAFASFKAGDIAPDDNARYRSKMINLFYRADQPLPDNAGRTISAWAWGASRAMDYLQTDPDIDPAKVAVIGHSRGGKTALWAGARDTRFAVVISNDSGSTGAKLARRGSAGGDAGTVAGSTSSFPHWYPPTYKAWGSRVDQMPVDQHELLALVAPRRVVVASATGDAHSDPQGEFLAYQAAAPVYALYGLGDTGLPSPSWPPKADQGFRGAAMSYHLRTGDHGLTAADWSIYLKGELFPGSAPSSTSVRSATRSAAIAAGIPA